MPAWIASMLEGMLPPDWRQDGRLVRKLNKLWERYPSEAQWHDAIKLLEASTGGLLDTARVHVALETRLREVQEQRQKGLPKDIRSSGGEALAWPPEVPEAVRQSCGRLKDEIRAIAATRPPARRSIVPLARAHERAISLVVEAVCRRLGGATGTGAGGEVDGDRTDGGTQ
jgi:hypothetical protein